MLKYGTAKCGIGFGTITFNFCKDEEGTPFTLNDLKEADEDATTTDAIKFDYIDNKTKEIVNTPACIRDEHDEEGNITGKREIYTDTAHIVADNDFYIYIDLSKFKENISTIYITISTGVVERKAEVYFLAGKYKSTSSWQILCNDCANKGVSDTTSVKWTEDKTGESYSGTVTTTYYPCGQLVTTYYKVNGNQWYKKVGNQLIPERPGTFKELYIVDTGEQTGKNITASIYKTTMWYCSKCGPTDPYGGLTINTNSLSYHLRGHTPQASSKSANVTVYQYVQTKVSLNMQNACRKPVGQGYRCGDTVSANTELDQQKLVIAIGKENDVEIVDTVPYEIRLGTRIEITPTKYNSYGANPKTNLDGAEFEIEAKQKGENLTVSKDNNGKFTITPKGKENVVYVLMKETTPPPGYKAIDPLNIVFTYNTTNNSWTANYCPDKTEWSKSGFKVSNGNDNTFSGWTLVTTEDGNSYYQSKNGDIITIDKTTNDDRVVKIDMSVYDKAVIEKLYLLKIDQDGGNKLLAGAVFTATLQNVESYRVGDVTTFVSEGDTKTFTIENGQIILEDVVFRDENSPIKITLTEITPPPATSTYYYKKLENPITITIYHHTPDEKNDDGTMKGITGSYAYTGTEEMAGKVMLNGSPIINNNAISYTKSENGYDKVVCNGALYELTIAIPNLRLIDLGGTVWVDGDTGVKPVQSPDGIMGKNEMKVANVYVTVYGEDGSVARPFNNAECTYKDGYDNTNTNGGYEFKGLRYGKSYYVAFNYDGIHYITPNTSSYNSNRNAKEDSANRTTFNNKFTTINNSMDLEYEYISGNEKEDGKSKLKTLLKANEAGKEYPAEKDGHLEMGNVAERFNMTANTTMETYTSHARNLNLGIVGRGTDLALSTNVYSADVSINGQTTTYNYDNAETFPNIMIDHTTTDRDIVYNLGIYASDYNYRIRNYVSNGNFVLDYNQNVGEADDRAPNGAQTGDEVNVDVTYTLQLQNQAAPEVTASGVEYNYDEKYEVKEIYFIGVNGKQTLTPGTDYTNTNNKLSITKDITFNQDNTDNNYAVNTLYLVFKVKKTDLQELRLGTFYNTAEITEYKTAEGLIDIDSAPGNMGSVGPEDDSDEANGIQLAIKEEVRKISGYVWDDANDDGQNLNFEKLIDGVIVQLVEMKNIEGKYYEYIWQETTSGSGKGKVMNDQGTDTIPYEFDAQTGYYEFTGFIPGDYVVRFIYGDGSTYDLTNDIVKYNGQDYKSTKDEKYNSEWYNDAGYSNTKIVNTARDNEARRLQTMAWSTSIDAEKGLLLKLLDLQTDAQIDEYVTKYLPNNKVEMVTLITAYNKYLDPDITDVTVDNVKDLLEKVTLANTWMCAETSKIKVPVDTTDLTNIFNKVEVNGINTTYVNNFENVALGLHRRPATQIRIEKEITTYILNASNGQELVKAYYDESGNLTGNIDNLQVIPGTSWKYSVSPTDLNTLIDGAYLEYTYRIKVTNESQPDYLSSELASQYESDNYGTAIDNGVKNVRSLLRSDGRNATIGKYLGSTYYNGVTDEDNNSPVKTNITNVRDYINNDVNYLAKDGTDFQVLELHEEQKMPYFKDGFQPEYELRKNTKGIVTYPHYTLNDDKETVQPAEITTILDSINGTGALGINDTYEYSDITIAVDTISSTGLLDFDNYIAEVMSFTNAAGRRAFKLAEDGISSVTPGNAKAVDAATEIDEAETAKIQIGEAYGEDKETSYTWLVAVVAGITVIAAGAFVTKKYIIK